MKWDVIVDVLCIGSGAGGLSAAITAASGGAKVLVVEKDHKVGGVTGISSGQCWVGDNSLARAAGIADSRAETEQYLQHLSQGLADPQLRDVFIDKGCEVVDFLTTEVGIPFRVVENYPDYYYPAVAGSKPSGRYLEVEPFAASQLGEWADRCIVSSYGHHYSYSTSQEWTDHQLGTGKPIWECLEDHVSKDERCAGAGLAAYMVKAALDRKVDIWLQAPAVKLIVEGGRVMGAIVKTVDGERRVRALRGVLLATSGYDWNKAMVRSYEALAEAGSMCPPTVEGDHLVMAAEVGVIPLAARAPAQSPVFIGYQVPGELVYGRPSYRMLLPGAPHSIIVNHHGKRFANDSFYPDVATKVARFDGQEQGMANWPAWLVFDHSMLQKYGLLPVFPGQKMPEGMAVSAASVPELAELTGIDAAGLSATITRFNSLCEMAVDEDFARGTVPWGRLMTGDPALANPNMAPLLTAPFYAVKIERVVMGVPTTGLPVNKDAQVIDAHGEPVVGLYAAGNATAWLDIGGGYNSGIANTRGLVQGYQSARHMLALAVTGN
ncbi:MAG: FAD-dependent oxidoreductase [Spongiibacteraceae bacterium]